MRALSRSAVIPRTACDVGPLPRRLRKRVSKSGLGLLVMDRDAIFQILSANEKKVLEGRQQRDLYERLKEAIDRSREMYDKRVRPEVSNRYDYFHHELVNMLAEGDPAKLGTDYPGARA